MGDSGAGPTEPVEDRSSLRLDALSERLETIQLLKADDEAERGRVLEQLGARGKAESDIIRQQALRRPLYAPDRFEEAHRLVVRGIEVLDRNGVRNAPMPRRLGPVRPVAAYVVQLITRFIVRNHQNTLIDRLRKLYELREANSAWGSAEHAMLRRARLQMRGLSDDLKAKALGVPTFLLGGAFISGMFSALGNGIRAALGHPLLVVVLVAVTVLLLTASAWCVLFAAAVARRRIRLSLDEPLHALYETIGACGDPPKDQSLQFALYAIGFFVLAAIVVPIGVGLVIAAR
jgi:hypothetical protein